MVRLDDLIARLQLDQKGRVKVEEPLSINIFTVSGNPAGQASTTGINGQFLHNQLLMDVLLRMKPNEKDKREFASLCKQEYDGKGVFREDVDPMQHVNACVRLLGTCSDQ